MADCVHYRKLKKYRYQTRKEYVVETGIWSATDVVSSGGFLKLTRSGRLTIAKGYAWDGASGPAINTKNFRRGSLVHDCFYQMLRESLIAASMRIEADKLLRRHVLEDGMWRIRAAWVYRGVRIGGKYSARPRPTEADLLAP